MTQGEKGRLLARGPGGMYIEECPCKRHYHLTVGKCRVTLSREEFIAFVRTTARAGKQMDDPGELDLQVREFYPVQ